MPGTCTTCHNGPDGTGQAGRPHRHPGLVRQLPPHQRLVARHRLRPCERGAWAPVAPATTARAPPANRRLTCRWAASPACGQLPQHRLVAAHTLEPHAGGRHQPVRHLPQLAATRRPMAALPNHVPYQALAGVPITNCDTCHRERLCRLGAGAGAQQREHHHAVRESCHTGSFPPAVGRPNTAIHVGATVVRKTLPPLHRHLGLGAGRPQHVHRRHQLHHLPQRQHCHRQACGAHPGGGHQLHQLPQHHHLAAHQLEPHADGGHQTSAPPATVAPTRQPTGGPPRTFPTS